jgi:hypothetical protein
VFIVNTSLDLCGIFILDSRHYELRQMNIKTRHTGVDADRGLNLQIENIFSCIVDEKSPNSRGIFPHQPSLSESGLFILFPQVKKEKDIRQMRDES